jgi:hypothetical protein
MLSRVQPQDEFERKALEWFEAMSKFRYARTAYEYAIRKSK